MIYAILVASALCAVQGAPAVGAKPSAAVRTMRTMRTPSRRVAARAGKYDPFDSFSKGVLSSNQQKVYISETQLKSANPEDTPNILGNVEKLKLLSTVEESGLLQLLQENGVTLKAIEELGLLTTAENLGLLSAASNPNTPNVLYGTAFGLGLLSTAALTLFPDDNALEGILKSSLVLGGAGGGVAAAIAARVLNTLQGQGYTQVGVESGVEDLTNLAEANAKKKKLVKSTPPILSNVEKLKLLSQVERSGLLSKLENAGLTLESVQKLKLLSTAERAKLLSLVTDTSIPGKLAATSAALLAAAAALVVAVPDDESSLVAAQAVGAAALALPAVAAAAGSTFLGKLQKA
mmetsp:Transcript_7343/g.10268  ORF Transcript_7343/g.10268 Transcript_7343/m.10268 type:complete len:349 (+) Transcript_7343:107-1153(+)